jgi:hypothetical protein
MLVVTGILALTVSPIWAQETPKTMVDSYAALADTILAVRKAEANFVRALLDGHRHAAMGAMQRGDHAAAAAQIALFANEGDNAVGGVRKRLLEGGHHFNADGETKGIYEEGYVVVTRAAKKQGLDIAKALRSATTDEARKAAWDEFAALAESLLKAK